MASEAVAVIMAVLAPLEHPFGIGLGLGVSVRDFWRNVVCSPPVDSVKCICAQLRVEKQPPEHMKSFDT